MARSCTQSADTTSPIFTASPSTETAPASPRAGTHLIPNPSADKQVIIWKTSPEIKPEAKYQQGDTIQCMEFDPLTGKLFSGSEGEFVLSSFGEKKIERNSYKGKILCCSWSPAGQFLAVGTL